METKHDWSSYEKHLLRKVKKYIYKKDSSCILVVVSIPYAFFFPFSFEISITGRHGDIKEQNTKIGTKYQYKSTKIGTKY